MAKKKVATNGAGVLVLQWLTYAFWGWFIVSMIWLVGSTAMHYMGQKGYDSFRPSTSYAVAAALVLFGAAFVSDKLYSKHEPAEKQRAAQLLMIIHAVLFALLAIAATVTALFSLVGIILLDINSYETTNNKFAMMITAVVVALLFFALLVRTVWTSRIMAGAKGFRYAMAGVLVVTYIAAAFGPIAFLYQTKQDRLIEVALPILSNDITNYATDKNALPKSLDKLNSSSDEVKTLIARNLVEYTPNTKPATSNSTSVNDKSTAPEFIGSEDKAFYYRLCVTYKEGKNLNDTYYKDFGSPSYSPDVYVHDKGRVCYDLVTSVYIPLAEPAREATNE